MKKLNILVIILFFVLFSASSCNILDSQKPQQSVVFDGDIENVEDLQKLLSGAYNSLAQQNWRQLILNDVMAEDAYFNGSFTAETAISKQDMDPTIDVVATIWNNAYKTINTANIILENSTVLESQSDIAIEVKDVKGQALFIRALQYYYLLQFYAPAWGVTPDGSHLGVPLQLEAIKSAEQFSIPSRSTAADVYSQIKTDLNTAVGLLQNTHPGRASVGSTLALAARIALIQEEWQNAADLAQQAIDEGYELNDDVVSYFTNEFSKESIFEIAIGPQDNLSAVTTYYNENGRDDIQITQAYLDALGEIITEDQKMDLAANNLTAFDARDSLLITRIEGVVIPDQSNTKKYESSANNDDNGPILRLPEMLLTRAEALAELEPGSNDISTEAVSLLNRIRGRAIIINDSNGNEINDKSYIEFSISDFSTKQELVDAILLERRVELSFEGHRLTDIKRRRLEARGAPWDDCHLVFPIPQTQRDTSKNKIEQNECYNVNS